MKKLVINGQILNYVGSPLQVTARETDGNAGGRTNFLCSNEKLKTDINLANLNECLYWLKQWSKEEDHEFGYILDYSTKTVYYNKDEVKDYLLNTRFPVRKIENYFETFIKTIPNKIILVPSEPNQIKSEELKKILLQRIKKGEKTPVKMIETISGNREVTRVHFNFVPHVFEPEYQFNNEYHAVPAIEGIADDSSYRLDLISGEMEPSSEGNNSIDCQATIFINNIVNFEL